MYEKIITHNDFDGVASAAICTFVYKIERIQFTGPNTVTNSQIQITENDIVCDLPYPLICGLWFDHHEGNLEELKYRHIDIEDIPGRFAAEPSCAHTCFDYFSAREGLPVYFQELVKAADQIDSFNYSTLEEWRQETPGKILENAIRARGNQDLRQKRELLRSWTLQLRDHSLSEVAEMPSVQNAHLQYLEEEKSMLQIIEQNTGFLPQDAAKELVILDFTAHKRRPFVQKNLAYLLYPEALAVIEVNSLFRRGTKTNDFGVSMALSLNLNQGVHQRDVGEIMRELNIGDGHAGAAGGTVYCKSKNEMLREKQAILTEMLRIWQSQIRSKN
ncbi:hypothetical protein KAH55_14195 [bacterium]|nr:hypothetical protein [bacterium]